MISVTYDYYSGEFFGKLPADEFQRNLVKARAFVRAITGGRSDCVEHDSAVAYAVKNAICEVAEVYATAERGEIVSESNDNVSVEYSRGGISGAVASPLSAASLHLAGTGLLYQGVYDVSCN